MFRRSTIHFTIAALAVMALGGGLASAAPTEEGSLEFGPYIGWVKWDDYNTFKPDDDVLYGGRFGYFINSALSAEASYQQNITEAGPNAQDFQLNSIRINALWNFLPGYAVRPFVTIGADYDSFEVEDFRDMHTMGGNFGGGVRWILNDFAGVRFDFRYVYHRLDRSFGEDQGNVEVMGGVSFMPFGGPPKDTDGDGVRDSKDKCPDTPRGATVDEHGCPKDSDGDGVLDGLDACPDTPKGCPVDARGCPLDTDGDGVIDCQDKCADTPRGAKVDPTGCPTDADEDGVWDGLDACPDTPKGCRVDAKGCPLDTDGDGVIDCRDKCPDTPRGTTVDADGCPPPKPVAPPVFPEGKKELILQGVYFDTDKWDLTEGSKRVLDQVAESLKANPDTRVEIQGHTDSTGGDKHNMDLSEKRAKAVRDYIISKGVAETQVTSKGYGETKPIADNKTKEGRAQNRRTEMVKIE
jgi:outer membrane protein OmpA-like peptidoglycan-associated protein